MFVPACLLWVDEDESSDKVEFVVTWETAFETDSNASVKELETFWSGIEESNNVDSKPRV